MFFRLFIILLLVPAIEIYLLAKAGSHFGLFPTLLSMLVISLIGAWLVRSQGFQILKRIRSEIGQGKIPAVDLLDGAMVLVGGILLMTPGFFTDFIGLFFLIPFTRAAIRRLIGLWLQKKIAGGRYDIRIY